MRRLEVVVHCIFYHLLTIFISCFCFFVLYQNEQVLGQSQIIGGSSNISSVVDYPSLSDHNLKIETVATGFDFPTGINFLSNNDIILLEKNTGNVKRFVNGTQVEKPLLHVNTNIKDERGLLGIAVSEKKNFNDNPFFIENKKITHNVFLYYIECNAKNLNCENQIY